MAPRTKNRKTIYSTLLLLLYNRSIGFTGIVWSRKGSGGSGSRRGHGADTVRTRCGHGVVRDAVRVGAVCGSVWEGGGRGVSYLGGHVMNERQVHGGHPLAAVAVLVPVVVRVEHLGGAADKETR